MYRGTTPTLCIKVNSNIDIQSASQIWISIKSVPPSVMLTPGLEEDEEIITINLDRIQFSPEHIFITLTQEETFKFKVGKNLLQVRALIDGVAYASNITSFRMDDVLQKGVIE